MQKYFKSPRPQVFYVRNHGEIKITPDIAICLKNA